MKDDTIRSWSLALCTLVLVGTLLVPVSAEKYALVVGVNEYPNDPMETQFKPIPVNNAGEMYNLLTTKCGFSAANIEYLKGSVTMTQLTRSIRSLRSKSSSKDLVVFYYCGHGNQLLQDYSPYDEQDGLDEAIALSDYDPYNSQATMLSDDALKDLFDSVSAGQKLLIFDSCSSGGLFGGLSQATSTPLPDGPAEQDFMGDFVPDAHTAAAGSISPLDLSGSPYVVIAACGRDESSWMAPYAKYTIFSKRFFEGFTSTSANKDGDTWNSAEEIFAYAKPLAINDLKGYGGTYRMNPQIYDGNQKSEVELSILGQVAGSIRVTSNPSGARIFLDGADTGSLTPATISVPAGTHTVTCKMTGYQDASATVTVAGGQQVETPLTLPSGGSGTGSIAVTSNPSGARIFIDGSDRGLVTPATITGVPAGTHTVTCKMTGYQDASSTVTVTGGQQVTISLTLPSGGSGTGSVAVTSNPSGARIFIDGRDRNLVTPATITGVPAGTHTVTCKMTGYQDKSVTVSVANARKTSISLTLEKSQDEVGAISVSSTPSGARIFLDGTDTGSITPATITSVTAGTHTITCTLTGYYDASTTISVATARKTTVSLALQKKAGEAGAVSVSSTPSGAWIFLDGTDTGSTTPATITSVPAGTHTVTCRMTGYQDASMSVSVSKGKTAGISLTLQKSQDEVGAISVSSTPSGARIFLDGTDTGSITPATINSVPAGTHTVTCKLNGYQDATTTVGVARAKKTSVSLTLQKSQEGSGAISVTSTPSGARIFVDGTDTGSTTPATINSVPAGTHTVTCKMTGYLEKSVTVSVANARKASISIELQKVQEGSGAISVTSTPSGARIFLDGTDRSLVTPATVTGVPAGTHTVTCKMSGYGDRSATVTVVSGQTASISLSLQKVSGSEVGSVSIRSSPSGARILIDGVDTGKTTPATITGVGVGTHTVTCTHPRYPDKSITVAVFKEITTNYRLNMMW